MALVGHLEHRRTPGYDGALVTALCGLYPGEDGPRASSITESTMPPPSPELTDRDRMIFRAAGFPMPAPDIPPPAPAESAEAALRHLAAPTARLLEAAAMALLYAARCGLSALPKGSYPPEALRRAGFILDTLCERPSLPAEHRAALERLGRSVRHLLTGVEDDPAPLPLSVGMSAGLSQHLQREPDLIARRWGVYGRLELRTEHP